MTKPLIIFGTGDIAKLAHFYFMEDSPYTVAAFTVDQPYCTTETFQGLPLIPFQTLEARFPPEKYDLFVALSYAQVNQLRAQKYAEAKSKGYTLVSYISSKATTWADLSVGDNCFILEDNTIQPFVKIGNNVTLWSGNHIGHDAVIGDHCFLASHIVVSGNVVIEPYCFVGVNATFRNNIRIAESCVIGAGALIVKNTEPNGVYTLPVRAEKHAKESHQLSRL